MNRHGGEPVRRLTEWTTVRGAGEEERKPVDIAQGEQRPAQGVPPVGGEAERPVPDVVGGGVQEPVDIGRVAPGGGEILPPELRRVPGPLEAKLSPEERAPW